MLAQVLLAAFILGVSVSGAPTSNVSLVDDVFPFADDVPLKIPQGDLLGKKYSSHLFNSYYSFKGIPYAQPPVGPLRFRNPRPHLGWSGVRDASKHGSECVQTATFHAYSGSEDCLFLNVYTPSLKGSRAVMFFIHGGSFTGGSGNTFYYGPEPLINEDVVLVTINYRLGFLGFFSTGDKHAPGNYGLKDCIEALQWVQDNIHHFGGDRNKVTIFGESAGSVLVNFLVLSRAAKGLFSQAISQSGVALSPWGLQTNPRTLAHQLARKMKLKSTDSEGIVRELMEISDLAEFAKQTPGWLDLPVPRGQHPFDFAPVIETEWVEPPAITEHPLDTLRSGKFNQVPYIIGANSHESLYGVRELIVDPFLFSKFEKNPHYLIPTHWNVDPVSPQAYEIVDALRNVYFGGESVKEKAHYVDFCTDTHFHYPTYKTAELIADAQTAPVYYYIFAFDGFLNYPKHLLLLDSYPGAMHADDIPYLFRIGDVPAPVLPGTDTYRARARMTAMWTNFAKSGNPTPKITSTLPVRWERIGRTFEYLWIDHDLVPSKNPYHERMSTWSSLDRKHGP